MVAFLTAAVIILSNFVNVTQLGQVSGDIKNFGAIIAGFAMFVGIIGIFRSHTDNIIKKKPLWNYSAILIGILAFFIIVGLVYGSGSKEFVWYYNTIYGPLTATTYSLLAFWVCSAAYRAFKPRTWESTVLVVAGLLVFFGVQPISALVSPAFNTIQSFIMNVLDVAGTRGIIIGIGIAVISLGLRIMLGWEKSWMGAD